LIHEKTKRVEFVKESKTLSTDWLGVQMSSNPSKNEIWKQFAQKAEKTSPIKHNGRSKETWILNLRKWSSPVMPPVHLFGDRLRTMFVESFDQTGVEGYLICLTPDQFYSHEGILFENSNGDAFLMTLSRITKEDDNKPCLSYLIRK
jgi:hypothetical protein